VTAAPLCPVHKRPGRYVFGSMVTCDREDEELRAAKAPAKPKEFTGRPRVPRAGDRVMMGTHCMGTVVTVSPGGQYVTVSNGQYTSIYNASGFTFEAP
jgi:hypothetical protein